MVDQQIPSARYSRLLECSSSYGLRVVSAYGTQWLRQWGRLVSSFWGFEVSTHHLWLEHVTPHGSLPLASSSPSCSTSLYRWPLLLCRWMWVWLYSGVMEDATQYARNIKHNRRKTWSVEFMFIWLKSPRLLVTQVNWLSHLPGDVNTQQCQISWGNKQNKGWRTWVQDLKFCCKGCSGCLQWTDGWSKVVRGRHVPIIGWILTKRMGKAIFLLNENNWNSCSKRNGTLY